MMTAHDHAGRDAGCYLYMPLLLYRYILTDLFKVFALTTLVLVAVISFGVSIRALTGEESVGPAQAITYMALAMIPMLQFALPFAAGFASTLVLHRMSTENEIVAIAASGISYGRLLAPILVAGAVLTLIMVVLTQSVIPRFWASMERVLASDVPRLLLASVERGVPFKLPGTKVQIFADDMRILPNPPDTQAESRLVLRRVVVAGLDDDGRVEWDAAGSQAIVDVYRIGDETYVNMVMSDAIAYDRSSGQLGGFDFADRQEAFHIPNPLRDELRAMTRSELLDLRDHPERYRKVRDAMDALNRARAGRAIAEHVGRELSRRGGVELVQESENRTLAVSAETLDGEWLSGVGGGPVRVEMAEGGLPTHRMDVDRARLRHVADSSSEPVFELELLALVVTDLRDGTSNSRAALRFPDLTLSGLDSSVVNRPEDLAQGGLDVGAVNRVQKQIDSLRLEITGHILARYAQAATAVLLLVLGATLAMLLRSALPLVIYTIAFLPSILDLIMISGGDKMMRDGNVVSGFAVMWGGNAALLALFLFAWWRLSKN